MNGKNEHSYGAKAALAETPPTVQVVSDPVLDRCRSSKGERALG